MSSSDENKKKTPTVTVTDESLRFLVRELFSNKGTVSNELEELPVSLNPSVGDLPTQEGLPVEPGKPPCDAVELRTSTDNLVKHVPDGKARVVYDTVKSVVGQILQQQEDEEMKVRTNNDRVSNLPDSKVEEALRKSIRTIILETVPITKLPPGRGPTAQNLKDMDRLRKWMKNMSDDDEDKERYVRKAQTAANLGSKGGGEFEKIGQEIGLAPSAAKRAYREAMMKARDIADMTKTPEGRAEFDDLLTGAVDDYVDYLASSGELSDEEITDLKMNPEVLLGMKEDPKTGEWRPLPNEPGSDDFREFLDKYITKARKSWHGEEGWKTRYDNLDLNDK